MDRISGYSQVSEIIPFDYSQPFLLFPVRHHSPVCSWQLIRAIKEYQPDVILIEGPENANDMIGVLTDERTKLPAAFYYYYKDRKKLISDEAEDYKCYYPFIYASPECHTARYLLPPQKIKACAVIRTSTATLMTADLYTANSAKSFARKQI